MLLESKTFKPPGVNTQHYRNVAWYGPLPLPPPEDDDSSRVFDPQYTLPAYLYGLQTWLIINELLYQIDPEHQPTFDNILEQNRTGGPTGGLPGWADFLKKKYDKAVLGLVKSDLPYQPYWMDG